MSSPPGQHGSRLPRGTGVLDRGLIHDRGAWGSPPARHSCLGSCVGIRRQLRDRAVPADLRYLSRQRRPGVPAGPPRRGALLPSATCAGTGPSSVLLRCSRWPPSVRRPPGAPSRGWPDSRIRHLMQLGAVRQFLRAHRPSEGACSRGYLIWLGMSYPNNCRYGSVCPTRTTDLGDAPSPV